jgi:hypothetical protein
LPVRREDFPAENLDNFYAFRFADISQMLWRNRGPKAYIRLKAPETSSSGEGELRIAGGRVRRPLIRVVSL